MQKLFTLIVLGFNDTSTLEGHFVSSPREREKRDRRESRGDEREGQGRKRNRNESEETEEIKTFPLYPYPLQSYSHFFSKNISVYAIFNVQSFNDTLTNNISFEQLCPGHKVDALTR